MSCWDASTITMLLAEVIADHCQLSLKDRGNQVGFMSTGRKHMPLYLQEVHQRRFGELQADWPHFYHWEVPYTAALMTQMMGQSATSASL